MQKNSHSCSALSSFSLPSARSIPLLFYSSFLFFCRPIPLSKILLACSFEWFEVLKRHSITRHLRDPEESDAIAEADGNGDDDRLRRGRRQWRRLEKNSSRAGWDRARRPNGSTRIARRVLMDYPSTRKPVDQRREFIVTVFPIDAYSYLDKRLNINLMLEYLTNMYSL